MLRRGRHLDLLVLGARIRIQSGDAGLLNELQSAWSRCLAPHDGAPPGHHLTVTEEQIRDLGRRTLMEQLTRSLTVEAMKPLRNHYLLLHAAAVAFEDGSSVALVGASGAGKTTAAAHLGSELAYVTDETAAIARDRTILRFPKPLSVIETGASSKRQVSPDELRLNRPGKDQLVLRGVVLLDRQPRVLAPSVEQVETIDAVAYLAEHTSYLSCLTRPLHRLAEPLDATGGLRRLTYSDANQLTPKILLGALQGGGA